MEVDLQAIDQDLKKIPFTEPKPADVDNRKPEDDEAIAEAISQVENELNATEKSTNFNLGMYLLIAIGGIVSARIFSQAFLK